MSRQIPHPTFARNVYTSLQMSQDVYIHLPSRMTLRQLRDIGITTVSKWNDKLWDSLSYFHKDLKRLCIIWTLKNKFKWGMVASCNPVAHKKGCPKCITSSCVLPSVTFISEKKLLLRCLRKSVNSIFLIGCKTWVKFTILPFLNLTKKFDHIFVGINSPFNVKHSTRALIWIPKLVSTQLVCVYLSEKNEDSH